MLTLTPTLSLGDVVEDRRIAVTLDSSILTKFDAIRASMANMLYDACKGKIPRSLTTVESSSFSTFTNEYPGQDIPAVKCLLEASTGWYNESAKILQEADLLANRHEELKQDFKRLKTENGRQQTKYALETQRNAEATSLSNKTRDDAQMELKQLKISHQAAVAVASLASDERDSLNLKLADANVAKLQKQNMQELAQKELTTLKRELSGKEASVARLESISTLANSKIHKLEIELDEMNRKWDSSEMNVLAHQKAHRIEVESLNAMIDQERTRCEEELAAAKVVPAQVPVHVPEIAAPSMPHNANGDYTGTSVNDLRGLLKARDLNCFGPRNDLIKRLTEADCTDQVEPGAPPAKKAKRKRGV